MLNTDLIQIINSGSAIAFVGSGVSSDSGAPSWGSLVGYALQESSAKHKLSTNRRYLSASRRRDYAECFQIIEDNSSREELESNVRRSLSTAGPSGGLAKIVASWPFQNYITTNYDNLIARTLDEIGKLGGWAEIGNTPDECRKIAGDAGRLIWHVHGGCELPDSHSRLILTTKDYDLLYAYEAPVVKQLASVLALKRIVFIGFGMSDPALNRLFDVVGRYSNPAMPAYAFLADIDGEDERVHLRERLNIEVIPYKTQGSSHAFLHRLLEIYGSFVLKRTQKYNQAELPLPSYHPETTSLLVHNELVLKNQGKIEKQALDLLMRACLLAHLSLMGAQSSTTLQKLLVDRIALLGGGDKSASIEDVRSMLSRNLKVLQEESLVITDDEGRYMLGDKGGDLVANQAAKSGRLYQQFVSSLTARARALTADTDKSTRIVNATEAFLKDCIAQRALGVALSCMYAASTDSRAFHATALLQALPVFIARLSEDEAHLLIPMVQDFLAAPTEAEQSYLGLVLQARFSITILGFDPNQVQSQIEQLRNTALILDASTMLHFFARSSSGNPTAKELMSALEEIGAFITTTSRLVEETAGHARWARDKIAKYGAMSPQVLAVALGREGYSGNLFVEGFVNEIGSGRSGYDFNDYLDAACSSSQAREVTVAAFESIGGKCGINVLNSDDYVGFEKLIWRKQIDLADDIKEARERRNTYTRKEQVQAEAEALVIVKQIRSGVFKTKSRSFDHAFFVSQSRVIDEVAASPNLPITINVSSLLQMINTVRVCTEKELATLTNALQWELQERGLSIVDRRTMQTAFAPLRAANLEELNNQKEVQKTLLGEHFGADKAAAYGEALDFPISVFSAMAQRTDKLAQQLSQSETARKKAENSAKISEGDKKELETLRAKQKKKKDRAERQKRAAKSKKRRRRRR